MLTAKAKTISIFLLATLFVPVSSLAYSLKQKVLVCDSFYNSSKAPSGQEGSKNPNDDFENMMMNRLVDCLNTYEKAGLQNKFEFAMVAHEKKLSAFKSQVSSTRTANCKESDIDSVYSQNADAYNELTAEFSNQKVKNINGFKGTKADTTNLGEFVGHFKIPRHPRGASCNANYIQYENGKQAIVTNAHCFYDRSCKLRAPLGEYKIEFGFQLGSRGNQSLNVKNIRCGTKCTQNPGDPMSLKDECIVETDRLPSGISPAPRVFYSQAALQKLRLARKISLFGFHPKRNSGEVIYGRNSEGPFDSRITRSLQNCRIQPQNYNSKTYGFLRHNCDTLKNSSGAAVALWNRALQRIEMIGLHRGPEDTNTHEENMNIAVNVLPSELIHSESNSIADPHHPSAGQAYETGQLTTLGH
jgi:hypothetical protein